VELCLAKALLQYLQQKDHYSLFRKFKASTCKSEGHFLSLEAFRKI
jgi:hypothetical protein